MISEQLNIKGVEGSGRDQIEALYQLLVLNNWETQILNYFRRNEILILRISADYLNSSLSLTQIIDAVEHSHN